MFHVSRGAVKEHVTKRHGQHLLSSGAIKERVAKVGVRLEAGVVVGTPFSASSRESVREILPRPVCRHRSLSGMRSFRSSEPSCSGDALQGVGSGMM